MTLRTASKKGTLLVEARIVQSPFNLGRGGAHSNHADVLGWLSMVAWT